MKTYKVPMANRIYGMFLITVVADSEDQAAFKAIELNPTSSIIGRIFREN